MVSDKKAKKLFFVCVAAVCTVDAVDEPSHRGSSRFASREDIRDWGEGEKRKPRWGTKIFFSFKRSIQ